MLICIQHLAIVRLLQQRKAVLLTVAIMKCRWFMQDLPEPKLSCICFLVQHAKSLMRHASLQASCL